MVKILSINHLTNGHAVLQCVGVAMQSHNVQATTDLSNVGFTTLTSITADANGNFTFEDTNAASFPGRFYRVTFP